MKTLTLNFKKINWILVVCIFVGLVITFFLSFQYFFLADFPIGQDVINHIASSLRIEKLGLFQAFKTSVYPLSSLVLIFWHKILAIFGFSYEKTFIFAECFHLSLTAIFAGVLSYRIFRDWRMALLTCFFVSSSRWLNEGLRTGLFAEILGWLFFTIALLFVFDKKWLGFLLTSLILFFIHPMVFVALIVIVFGFLIYWFIKAEFKERIKLFLGLLVFLLVFVVLYLILPDLFLRIKSLIGSFFSVSTDRSVIDYVIDSGKRRILFYAFAFFGLLFFIFSKYSKEKKWLIFIFTFISFWFCFAHIVGLKYLDFRLYGFFEIACGILAAFSLIKMSEWVWFQRPFLIYVPLAFMLIYPNWLATKEITIWQLNDYSAGHITPLPERKVLKQITPLLNPKARIYSNSIWVLWFRVYDFQVFGFWSQDKLARAVREGDGSKAKELLQKLKINYIYFSSIDPFYEIEKESWLKKVYDQDNLRIYEIVLDYNH